MVFNRRSQSAHSCCKIRQQASSSIVGRLSHNGRRRNLKFPFVLNWYRWVTLPSYVKWLEILHGLEFQCKSTKENLLHRGIYYSNGIHYVTTWRIQKAFNWAGLIEGRRSIFRPLNGIIPRQGLVSFIVRISFTTCWHFLQLSFMARLGEGRSVGHHHVANSGKGFHELVERPSLIFALVVVHHYLFFVFSLVRYRWLRSNGEISKLLEPA